MRDLIHYNAVRHMVDTGDLVEWAGTSFVARAIRWRTGKAVNHSSLVVRLPYEGDERRFIVEAVATGLEFHLLSKVLEQATGTAHWYRLKPEYERPEIGKWAFGRLAENSGYDYGDLFRQLFGRVSLDSRRYFCSEFVQHAYVECGVITCPEGFAMRPGDFAPLGIYSAQAQIL
jgi:hypothetical protein